MKSPVLTLSITVLAAGAMIGVSRVDLAGQAGTPNAEAVKAFIAAQMTKNWTPPKTPWGDPEIHGVFTTKDEANTPFERPDEWAGRRIDEITPKEFAAAVARRQVAAVEQAPFFAGNAQEGLAIGVPIHWFDNLTAKNSRPWFVIDPPDGKIPSWTAEAKARPPVLGEFSSERRADTYSDRSFWDRCISRGVPVAWTGIYGNSYQILQTPDYVVIRTEMVHEARMIPLDGRPHLSATIDAHAGDGRGHWDGSTLVVETTNLDRRLNYRGAPARSLRVIERFTRTAPDKVEWTMTFDDSTTWTRPWSFSMPLTRDDTHPIHEYACHEGNYGLANILTAARALEKKRAENGR